MILVTGAAGKTGQAVVQAVQKRGAAVRAFAYRREHTEPLLALGAQDVVVGDMRDEDAFVKAAQDASAIYHICPNMSPYEMDIGRKAIAAAQRAGVGRFVYHSVLHPQMEAMPHHWHKLRVEEMLLETDLDFTVLQPAAYMQNILAGWSDLSQHGVYRVPYPPQTLLNMVDLEDVAAVAGRVLSEPGHAGATYQLAGPDNLVQTEVADILSRCLGQAVRIEEIPLEIWARDAAVAGLGEYQISTLEKMFRYYAQHGFWGNPRALRWLLQRPPTTLEAFVLRTMVAGKKLP
jgi:uncharacterized protein YbjT (DUF2867 family)